jgi:hypothetical protein
MIFKDAYKEILNGKRVCKPDLKVNLADGNLDVSYMSMVIPSYIESNSIIKQDPAFIAAFDINGGIHRIGDANAISMLLSDDDDWAEWVVPQASEAVEAPSESEVVSAESE